MKTIAQLISDQFGNDGQRWIDDAGIELAVVCEQAGGEADQNWDRELTRYTFQDGSAITIESGGWDLGYAECFCRVGEGHDTDMCEARVF